MSNTAQLFNLPSLTTPSGSYATLSHVVSAAIHTIRVQETSTITITQTLLPGSALAPTVVTNSGCSHGMSPVSTMPTVACSSPPASMALFIGTKHTKITRTISKTSLPELTGVSFRLYQAVETAAKSQADVTSPAQPRESNSGVNNGAIIGAVIASIAIILAVLVCLGHYCKRAKYSKHSEDAEKAQSPRAADRAGAMNEAQQRRQARNQRADQSGHIYRHGMTTADKAETVHQSNVLAAENHAVAQRGRGLSALTLGSIDPVQSAQASRWDSSFGADNFQLRPAPLRSARTRLVQADPPAAPRPTQPQFAQEHHVRCPDSPVSSLSAYFTLPLGYRTYDDVSPLNSPVR